MKKSKKMFGLLGLGFSLFFLAGCNAWPASREAAVTEEEVMINDEEMVEAEGPVVGMEDELILDDEAIEGMTDDEFLDALEAMDEVLADEDWNEMEAELE